jgi:hypothetical protein
MSGNTLKGIDRDKCPSAQFYDRVLVNIAKTLRTDIMFCNFRGECQRTLDEMNCMDPTPEEAIKIVEVIITFAKLADALQGAVVLQICGGKAASRVMLPKLKKRIAAAQAWPQNGHVMCANPVHLTRLRKQWLMRTSATRRRQNRHCGVGLRISITNN